MFHGYGSVEGFYSIQRIFSSTSMSTGFPAQFLILFEV